jgi:putative spermidine/putrescine transport system substrate-binding protein
MFRKIYDDLLINPNTRVRLRWPAIRVLPTRRQTVYAAAIARGGSWQTSNHGLEFFKELTRLAICCPHRRIGPHCQGRNPHHLPVELLALANKDNFAGNPPIGYVYPKSVKLGVVFTCKAVSAFAPNPAARPPVAGIHVL